MSAMQPGRNPEPNATARGPVPLRPERWLRRALLLATVLVLLVGAVDDVYGNTDTGDVYGSDAVQYLDIARAMARHDWRSAWNPLWSQAYPALLACVRGLLPAGPGGDWWTTRAANFLLYAAGYAAFLFLLFTLCPAPPVSDRPARRAWLLRAGGCVLLFLAAQTCLGQVSRVGPDELVNALFLLACALLLRLFRGVQDGRAPWPSALVLGLTLGSGFLVKAAFLPLGAGMLAIAAVALRKARQGVLPVVAAAAIFAAFVLSYGATLSHAVGYPTLGEAGSLNYAWHVDRLQKWVHWEGGVLPAAEAWPKPALARAAEWDTRPPDFGAPVHPSRILQSSPTVFGFAAPSLAVPVRATYVPYFDPAYFYRGYRHVFRWRYQAIALGKNLADLFQVLAKQPIAWALLLGCALLLWTAPARRHAASWMAAQWPLLACSLLGVLLFLPVHLEGRYIAGMLLVFGMCVLLGATHVPASDARFRAAGVVLLLGMTAELGAYQLPLWRNLLHRQSPTSNVEWRMGVAAIGQRLPGDAPVGVIAWTPNLHCDWAYIAHLRIVSEVASGPDYDQFWHLPPERQAATLETFRRSGAVAVFVNGKPPGLGSSQWQQLNGTPLWMVRFP